MSTIYEFDVYGQPITQGSKRAFRNPKTGRIMQVESTEAKLRPWRAAMATAAEETLAGAALLRGPVAVTLRFWMLRPKSHKGRTWPAHKGSGDVDKLARAVLDALTNVMLADDAQVVALGCVKDYGDRPGVQVRVQTLPDDYATRASAMALFVVPRPDAPTVASLTAEVQRVRAELDTCESEYREYRDRCTS